MKKKSQEAGIWENSQFVAIENGSFYQTQPKRAKNSLF